MLLFTESVVQRPPRLDRVADVLAKVHAYILKFNNLGVKLQSSYRKLEAYETHGRLVQACLAAKSSVQNGAAARETYRTLWREERRMRLAMKEMFNGGANRITVQ